MAQVHVRPCVCVGGSVYNINIQLNDNDVSRIWLFMCVFSHSFVPIWCISGTDTVEQMKPFHSNNISNTTKTHSANLFCYSMNRIAIILYVQLENWRTNCIWDGSSQRRQDDGDADDDDDVYAFTLPESIILFIASNVWIYEFRIQWMCDDVNLPPRVIDGMYQIACDPLWFAFNILESEQWSSLWNERELTLFCDVWSILTKAHAHLCPFVVLFFSLFLCTQWRRWPGQKTWKLNKVK